MQSREQSANKLRMMKSNCNFRKMASLQILRFFRKSKAPSSAFLTIAVEAVMDGITLYNLLFHDAFRQSASDAWGKGAGNGYPDLLRTCRAKSSISRNKTTVSSTMKANSQHIEEHSHSVIAFFFFRFFTFPACSYTIAAQSFISVSYVIQSLTIRA